MCCFRISSLRDEKILAMSRGFIEFLCRRSVGFFSRAFLVFLIKESKKRMNRCDK